MSEVIQINDSTMLNLVTNGDLSRLTPDQKLQYYKARCDAAGLDPRCKPFDVIKMNGKEILYPTKECSNQLASKHGVVCEVVSQITENGIRTVIVRARAKDGRQTDEIGCVTVDNLKGDALCNAYMKSVTKAKRRAILSICGLGLNDEIELETIPQILDPIDKIHTAENPILDVQPSEKIKEQNKRFNSRFDNGQWRSIIVHTKGNYTGKTLGEIQRIGKLENWFKWTPKKDKEGCISAQDQDLKDALDAAYRESKISPEQQEQVANEYDQQNNPEGYAMIGKEKDPFFEKDQEF